MVTQAEDDAPAGQVEEAQQPGCEELAAQQLVDGLPRRVQRAADRVVCWAGSRSPSLLESLLASLDEVLGSGLVLARRLGDIAGTGSRGRRV